MSYAFNPDLDHHSRSRFIALTDELCSIANQPVQQADSAEMAVVSLVVDDVPFDLIHDSSVGGDVFLVECELGPPPEDEETLLGLLQANMQMLRDYQGSFGLRHEGDKTLVTHGRYLSLTDSHATAVQATMQAAAHRALAWRTGEFS